MGGQPFHLHFTPSDSGAPRILAKGATTGGLGMKPPVANGFLRFSCEKTLILARFFYRKRACSEYIHYG